MQTARTSQTSWLRPDSVHSMVLGAIVKEISNPKKQFGTLFQVHSRPQAFLECIECRFYGLIRVSLRVFGNIRYHLFCCGIGGVHRGAVSCIAPLPVDKDL